MEEVKGMKSYEYFLETLYQHDSIENRNVQASVLMIVERFDALSFANNFDLCNQILKYADVEKLTSFSMRSLLAVSFPIKDKLSSRKEFFDRVKKHYIEIHDPKIAERYLRFLF